MPGGSEREPAGEPKRVVIVATVPTFPSQSGMGRRLEAIVAEVGRQHDVVVLAALPPAAPNPLPGNRIVLRTDRPPGGMRALPRMAACLIRRVPLTTSFYVSRGSRRALSRHLREIQPNLLLVHGVGGAVLARGLFPQDQTILDLPDAEHERAGAVGRQRGWRGVPSRLDTRRLRSWFTRELPRYKLVSAVSNGDLQSYRRLAPTARLVLCPNGSDITPEPRPDPDGHEVLFLGDLTYVPNAAGLAWFVREVLPGLPGVTLRVVGRGRAPSAANVVAAGFVGDLGGEWRRAAALVVPIFVGGGTRVKVLEAMGTGVPVVSTPFGVEGLGVEDGVHYLSASDAGQMREAVERVLGDRALRDRMGKAGHRLVQTTYTWERCLAPMAVAISEQ